MELSDRESLTPNALLRFESLLTPKVNTQKPHEPPKFEAVFMFAPEMDLTTLKTAALNAGLQKFGPRETWPAFQHQLFKRAEDMKQKHYGAYAGYTVLTARNADIVGVIDEYGNPITNAREIFAGCTVVGHVRFAGYDSNGNKGISCYLQNVMRVSKGERLTGGASAEAVFKPMVQTAPGAASAATPGAAPAADALGGL